MDFEQALVYELQTINGLSKKVFPQKASENTEPPFIVYFSTDGEPIMTLTGSTNLTELSCQIVVVAKTYEQLKSLSKAVQSRVKSFFQRPIGVNGLFIKSVSFPEPNEDIDNNLDYHSSTLEVRIRY
jgi:hypothetical protein